MDRIQDSMKLNSLLVSKFHPGGHACTDVQEVLENLTRELERRDQADVVVHGAGAAASSRELDGGSEVVREGDSQGVQIENAHSCCGGAHDHEGRLCDCALGEESPG
eukprot:1019439-Pleurochrysis_carterae.AAC.1